ncbi:MAG: IS110 family transposase [Bacteroidia bacterium]|jgi:transposase
MKKNEFRNFVGIDVSKLTLDAVFIFDKEMNKAVHHQFSNDEKGIKKLIGVLKKQKGVDVDNTLVCMENTGIYGKRLSLILFEMQWFVWVETPVAIFRSMGLQRGKNDKVDAKRIALYAMKNQEQAKAWEAPRKEIAALRQLLNTREALIKAFKGLSVSIKEYKETGNKELSEMMKVSTSNTIKGIKKDIQKIEESIDEIIKNDSSLSNLYKLTTSIPGIGKITSTELICYTNEFKNYTDAKKLACYCGVVPFEHSSGTSVRGRTRVSHMANKPLKTKLHLCAIVAMQHDPELKNYYQRKVKEGKNKMSVINAIRNKLVHRVTAVIKRQTPFVKMAA